MLKSPKTYCLYPFQTGEKVYFVETYSINERTSINNPSDKVIKYIQKGSIDENGKNNVFIYNLDYSIYKTVKVNVPTDYHLYILTFATTAMFNNDELVEFACVFSKENNSICHLYNENGDLLYDFKEDIPQNASLNLENKFKLYTSNDSNGENSIYSLTRTVSETKSLLRSKIENPYPNPAKQMINLPYQLEQSNQTILHIFDSNGKEVAIKQISSTFNKIILDVSTYSKGLYIYEYDGKSGKFIVE